MSVSTLWAGDPPPLHKPSSDTLGIPILFSGGHFPFLYACWLNGSVMPEMLTASPTASEMALVAL